MATPAPVSPKRKPRIYRDITDTVQVLFAKVLEVSNQFQRDTDKAKAKKMGQDIVDRASGDTQANRRDMVFLLKEARLWIADELAQATKKARALAQREALIAPAVEGWKAANQAWVTYVLTEKELGHDGLRAIWQGTHSVPGLWTKFAEMESKVKTLAIRGNQDDVAALTAELAILTEEVCNFSIPNWCQHEGCGAPIEKTMTPKGGGKPFSISFCHEHVSDRENKPAGKKGKISGESDKPLAAYCPPLEDRSDWDATELEKFMAEVAEKRAKKFNTKGKQHAVKSDVAEIPLDGPTPVALTPDEIADNARLMAEALARRNAALAPKATPKKTTGTKLPKVPKGGQVAETVQPKKTTKRKGGKQVK